MADFDVEAFMESTFSEVQRRREQPSTGEQEPPEPSSATVPPTEPPAAAAAVAAAAEDGDDRARRKRSYERREDSDDDDDDRRRRSRDRRRDRYGGYDRDRYDRDRYDRDRRGSYRDDRDRRDRRDRDRDRKDRDRRDRRDREEPKAEPEEETREKTPEMTKEEREQFELERDLRTVFIQGVFPTVDDRQLKEFFSEAGKVREIRMIRDRKTGRSKGFGYIEFFERQAVQKALMMDGREIKGRPIIVTTTEAEKNRQPSTANTSTGDRIGPTRLYVGNLHVNVTEDDLRDLFEPFGPVDNIQVILDESGASRGYGFVHYKEPESARGALMSLNGLEVAGHDIKVNLATSEIRQDPGGLAELDDEGGGVVLNAQSRLMLMAKLQRDPAPMAPPGLVPGLPGLPPPLPGAVLAPPAPPDPTPCVVLKNMFDPAAETEPNWDVDIGEDVREECSKFGAVTHNKVDKDSAGFVYIKFDSPDAAQLAQQSLNHRWFAGKMITCDFIPEDVYRRLHPDAR